MWFFYELLYLLGYLIYLPGAVARRRLPHSGWRMRLGCYPKSVLDTLQNRETFWLHAVSVGEFMAARPLIDALHREQPQTPIVCSSVTPGGYGLARKHVDGKGVPIYLPMDLKCPIRRAINRLHPKILILMESEIWPRLIQQSEEVHVPVVVVNGRVSDRTYARAKRRLRWVRPVLNRVSFFLMQSEQDAARVRELAGERAKIRVTGNLKWDASFSFAPSAEDLNQKRHELHIDEGDSVLTAGSTHRGEEKALLNTLRQLNTSAERPVRLILAPRHLERLPEVEAEIRSAGFRYVRYSQSASKDWQVLLVDVFGQMPLLYGLADAVFIGGSLIPHGGQNPLEAAALGKPTVFGPHMHNFSEITRQLLEAEAAEQLESAASLLPAVRSLLENPTRTAAIAENARKLSHQSLGATQLTFEAINELLEGDESA